MKNLLLATGALLVASAAPAFAQDAAPAPSATTGDSPVATFTGPRAEIFGGWDRVGTRARSTFADGTRDTVKSHRDGFIGGGQLGYDMPVGQKMTAGVFGSYAISTARSCAETGGCIKAGREIEGGARLGYKLADDKALAYVKGAYVNGRIRDTLNDVSANRDGWRAGAGVEYAFTPHVYSKVEYDYTRFKSYKFDTALADNSLRFDRNQVLAGFGVRF
jgi:outer membrane immunogenic protein